MRRPWLCRLVSGLLFALIVGTLAASEMSPSEEPPQTKGRSHVEGTVLVRNNTVIPLTIQNSEQKDLARLAPGSSTRLELEAGTVPLRAVRQDGAFYVGVELAVRKEGTTLWEILPTEGTLILRNRSTEALSFEIDGQPMGEIDPGATLRLDGISPGTRLLEARNSRGVSLQRVAAEIVARGEFNWELGQADAASIGQPLLRIRNYSGQTVQVRINDAPRIRLEPGETTLIGGLKVGPLRLEARDRADKVVASQRVQLDPGELEVWELGGREGQTAVLEVSNPGKSALKVCVDGALCLRVAPGKRIQYDAIRPGLHTLQAYELKSERLLDALEAEFAPGKPYLWEVDVPGNAPAPAP